MTDTKLFGFWFSWQAWTISPIQQIVQRDNIQFDRFSTDSLDAYFSTSRLTFRTEQPVAHGKMFSPARDFNVYFLFNHFIHYSIIIQTGINLIQVARLLYNISFVWFAACNQYFQFLSRFTETAQNVPIFDKGYPWFVWYNELWFWNALVVYFRHKWLSPWLPMHHIVVIQDQFVVFACDIGMQSLIIFLIVNITGLLISISTLDSCII